MFPTLLETETMKAKAMNSSVLMFILKIESTAHMLFNFRLTSETKHSRGRIFGGVGDNLSYIII